MLTEKDIAIFWEELDAVCQWDEDEIEDSPERATIMADIQTKTFGPEVLDEAMDCLTRDWVWESPKLKKIWLRVLAANGRLEKWDEAKEARTIHIGSKPKKLRLDGETYYHP